ILTPSPSVTADLIIDGRPSGQLPPFVHTLAAGTHSIEVKAEGYKPFATTVDVRPGGQPIELTAKLEPERPLHVDSVVLAPPAPAAEEPVRKKPASRRPPRLPDTVVPIEPMLPAAAPPPPVVAATPVAPVSVGYLVVQTKPATRLTIDGKDTGRWTPVPAANPISLPAGAHLVVLETADGRRLEEQVQIEAGKTARFARVLP